MSLLTSLFSRTKLEQPQVSRDHVDEVILTLIADLQAKLKSYALHYELNTRIDQFKGLSLVDRREKLPGLYLEIEDFLLRQNSRNSKTRDAFRKGILIEYPQLKKLLGFYLIFMDYDSQKIALSRFFLKDILTKAKDLLGKFNDAFLKEAEEVIMGDLTDPNKKNGNEFNSVLKGLYDFSDLIQKKIENSLGSNAMLSLYNNTFNKHFQNYQQLEAFTTIINLVPEELLDTENSNLPSKGQMHRLLKTQISTLEEINTKLSKEVQDRKEVQKELERNERLYAAVLHNSLDANVIFNKEGTIVRCNAKASELFQTGNNLYNLLPTVFSANLKKIINDFSIKEIESLSDETFEFFTIEYEVIKYFSLKLSPVYFDDSILFFAIISDITDQKQAVQQIEEARNIAEKSAKAKTTFLSNMSHEIRTPLNIVLGLSELFSKESFSGTDKEYENIEMIRFSAENLLTLVNDILDFSKIEAGKLNVQKVDFNLYEVIENLNFGFTVKANEKGLEYITKLGKEVPRFVVGDQYRLSQILNNLLSNAIKFTREGSVTLDIEVVKMSDENVTLRFKVGDTGIGIREDSLDSIFESFYQTIDEKGQKPIGTGLGLSITRQLVELQQGSLNVKSELGKGSCFSFDIEYQTSDLFESGSIIDITPGVEQIDILKDKHILVAEDNKLNQLFIKQLLSKWDAHVTIAKNGKEALDAVQKEDFDLVLMDVHMPIINGLEATKKIRGLENERMRKVPIVACSADVFPESRKQAEEAGVDFYITKPVNKDSIKEILFLLTHTEI